MGLHHHRKKAVPASGRRFENAAEGGYTFVIAPPTLISAALRFIFRRVSLKSCLFCNYRETTLPICRSVWSGFALFGNSPLQDDEWVWSVFAFFGTPLYRIESRSRGVLRFLIVPLYRMTKGCRVVLPFSTIPLHRIAKGCGVVLSVLAIPLHRITKGYGGVLRFFELSPKW